MKLLVLKGGKTHFGPIGLIFRVVTFFLLFFLIDCPSYRPLCKTFLWWESCIMCCSLEWKIRTFFSPGILATLFTVKENQLSTSRRRYSQKEIFQTLKKCTMENRGYKLQHPRERKKTGNLPFEISALYFNSSACSFEGSACPFHILAWICESASMTDQSSSLPFAFCNFTSETSAGSFETSAGSFETPAGSFETSAGSFETLAWSFEITV